MPFFAMPQTVVVKVELASTSVIGIQTVTVESCLVTIGVTCTVGGEP